MWTNLCKKFKILKARACYESYKFLFVSHVLLVISQFLTFRINLPIFMCFKFSINLNFQAQIFQNFVKLLRGTFLS